MKKFKELGLSEETLKVLKKQGIVEPTEIQTSSIPFALEGRDVIAVSATGSGKTLAFASAIIEKIIPNGKVQSIILAPTRELAEQVSDSVRLFADNRLKIVSVYGGVPIENQISKLRKADVVVGTPGRVIDHLERGSLRLRDIKILVLDEFDRMLDMGFHRDVDKIISQSPKDRQTLLFSATISGVEHLLDEYTNNAAEVTAKVYVDHSKLKQVFYDTPSNVKFSLLVQLLKEEKKDAGLIIVFCSTRKNVDFVTENLNNNNIHAKAIHGGLEQKKRMKVLKEFHSNGGVLVCTDVAARGLDIKGVSHVYNYDLPKVVDDYVHRIGRTARAGEEGIAINILTSRDYEIFSDILNQKKMKIEEMQLPFVERAIMDKNAGQGKTSNSRSRQNDPSRGRNNRRDSSNRRESRRVSVEMFDAVCKKCGKKCQVPFKPKDEGNVSCSDCYVRNSSGSSRRSDSRGQGRRSDRNSPGRRSESRRRR